MAEHAENDDGKESLENTEADEGEFGDGDGGFVEKHGGS